MRRSEKFSGRVITLTSSNIRNDVWKNDFLVCCQSFINVTDCSGGKEYFSLNVRYWKEKKYENIQ